MLKKFRPNIVDKVYAHHKPAILVAAAAGNDRVLSPFSLIPLILPFPRTHMALIIQITELLIQKGAIKPFFDKYKDFKWESQFFYRRVSDARASKSDTEMPYVSFIKYPFSFYAMLCMYVT